MENQKLLEYKPTVDFEAMLKKMPREITPLKLVDYYPTNFVFNPIDDPEKIEALFARLREKFENTKAFDVFRNAVAKMPKDENAIVIHLKKYRQHNGPFMITVDLPRKSAGGSEK